MAHGWLKGYFLFRMALLKRAMLILGGCTPSTNAVSIDSFALINLHLHWVDQPIQGYPTIRLNLDCLRCLRRERVKGRWNYRPYPDGFRSKFKVPLHLSVPSGMYI